MQSQLFKVMTSKEMEHVDLTGCFQLSNISFSRASYCLMQNVELYELCD